MWKTKEGKYIPYNKLKDSHILNIKTFIEKKAKEWVKIIMWWWFDCNDIWYDEDIIYWKEALEELDYDGICEEINKRSSI